ncbi:MAG: hypothetical protein AB7G25_02280 [Sphingomonadaceae bacterium]
MRRARAYYWGMVALALLVVTYLAIERGLKARNEAPPQERVLRLNIVEPRSVPVPPIFRANEGDLVTVTVHSRQPGAVHIHGYEKMVILRVGGDASARFRADIAGRFDVHYHDPNGLMFLVVALEVQPR